MFQTKLHMSSVGIVAEDRKINSNIIKVYPIEYLPNFDGELIPTEASLNSAGVDLNDNEYSVTLNVTNVIEANWLSLATNRETAPDVVKGEQVILWSYADAEGYYWTSMGRDDNLRKLETVVYTFSDIPNNSGEQIKGQNNQYTVEVSTHGKHITVKTCKNDKEPFAYTLQINAKDGCVFLTDDASNFIILDSKNTNIKAKNKNGTVMSLNKSDMHISAPNNIDIKSGNNYNLKAGGSVNIESGSQMSISSGSTMNISASSAIAMKASGISMVSASARGAKSGSMSFVGNVSVNGTANFSDSVTAISMKASDFYGNFHGTLFGNIA